MEPSTFYFLKIASSFCGHFNPCGVKIESTGVGGWQSRPSGKDGFWQSGGKPTLSQLSPVRFLVNNPDSLLLSTFFSQKERKSKFNHFLWVYLVSTNKNRNGTVSKTIGPVFIVSTYIRSVYLTNSHGHTQKLCRLDSFEEDTVDSKQTPSSSIQSVLFLYIMDGRTVGRCGGCAS